MHLAEMYPGDPHYFVLLESRKLPMLRFVARIYIFSESFP